MALVSCNKDLVPVSTTVDVATISFTNNTLCVSDTAHFTADLRSLMDSLHKGFTVQTGYMSLHIWQDSLGKVMGVGKLCIPLK